jgi:hypothetical protein
MTANVDHTSLDGKISSDHILHKPSVKILSHVGWVPVTYKTDSGLHDWIDTSYIHTSQDCRLLHRFTIQFTVAHALDFSAFTSRILATDLQHSHCHFKSHIKSSFHSLNSFLAIILQLSISNTRLNSNHLSTSDSHFSWNTQKTQSVSCWQGLITNPLPNNWRPIVARVCFCGNAFTELLPSNGCIRHNISHRRFVS